MSKLCDNWQRDLLRPPLDQIIAMGLPLTPLTREIDWSFLNGRFCLECRVGPGQAPFPKGRAASG